MKYAIAMVLFGLVSSHSLASTVSDADNYRTLQEINAKVYAAMSELVESGSDKDAYASDLPQRVERLRQAATRVGSAERMDASSEFFARKVLQVGRLIGNLEHAATASPIVLSSMPMPQHAASLRRSQFEVIDDRKGKTCERPFELTSASELDGFLPTRSELWLRFDASAGAVYGVDSKPSPLDTEITVFEGCPRSSADRPLLVSDDAFGLAAAAIVDLRSSEGPRWIRVRNLGEGGQVAIVAGEPMGTISGHIEDAHTHTGITPAQALLFDADGFFVVTSDGTDSAGNYEIAFAPGNYYVAAGAYGYLGELLPGIPCNTDSYSLDSCNSSAAQLVTIVANVDTSGIDFDLGRGATINGHVLDRVSGIAITSVSLVLYDENAHQTAVANTDGVGRYQFPNLAPGTYYIEASTYNYVAEVYADIDCPTQTNCPITSGTALTISGEGIVNDIDLRLQPMRYVDATVNLATTLPPLSTILVDAFSPSTGESVFAIAYPGQPASIGPLRPGAYYFSASANGFFSQLYDHVDCVTDCQDQFAQAELVNIAASAAPPELRFDLLETPTISGRITDVDTGTGLANVNVFAFPDATGSYAAQAITMPDGTYTLQLPMGTYYVAAQSFDHRDTAYPNAPCSDQWAGTFDCDLSQVQALTIAYGGSDILNADIALPRNASISGTVRLRMPGPALYPLSSGVTLYDALGSSVAWAVSDWEGSYSFNDLAAGTYFIEVDANEIYGQIFSHVDCADPGLACDPTRGTPIVLTRGQSVANVDFDPVSSTTIVGRVVDAYSGLGIAGVAMDLWSGDDESHCMATSTDANGYYAVGADTFFCGGTTRKLSTDAGDSYINQVYAGIACPEGSAYLGLCSLDAATLIHLPSTVPQPIVANFILHRPDVIFESGFD